MSEPRQLWFRLNVVAIMGSLVAPWRVAPPAFLRGYDTILMIPFLLFGASEGMLGDLWTALASTAGWVGVALYFIARHSKPDSTWLARLPLATALGAFFALGRIADPPFWRFWSWGFWVLWAGLISSVLLEATLMLHLRGGTLR